MPAAEGGIMFAVPSMTGHYHYPSQRYGVVAGKLAIP